MKTLKAITLKQMLTTAIFASVAFTANVQADDSLSNLIYEDSTNIFADITYEQSSSADIISYSDDHNKNRVWSAEYEEYVNPADFKQLSISSVGDVNQYMGDNPTAAQRMKGREVFIYNQNAGDYHLQ